jgi:hypothetical protein
VKSDQIQGGSGPCLAIATATFLLYLPSQAAAVSQSYLDAVKAEVDELNAGRFKLPHGSPWTRGTAQAGKPDTNSPEYQDFNKMLHDKFLGTYIQYKRLSAAQ